jgi:hypothetical protein
MRLCGMSTAIRSAADSFTERPPSRRLRVWFTKIARVVADLITGIQAALAAVRSDGKRSTVMASLHLPMILLVLAAVASAKAGAPTWLIGGFAAFAALLVLTFIRAYLYFMVRNPDALRTEAFTLEKMKIRNLLGDNKKGLIEIVEQPSERVARKVRKRSALHAKSESDRAIDVPSTELVLGTGDENER